MRLLATVLLCTAALSADTFKLGEGRAVKGELLKETADTYFIDLGFDVIAVPKKAVLAREADDAAEKAAARTEVSKAKGDLYSTIRRAEASVKTNVARTEGAVVMVRTPSGLGSGFIISPDGYVVTNDHVIQGETKITVVIFEKKDGALSKRLMKDVKIVAMNPYWDLALLKMEDVKDLPVAYLGDSDELRVGGGCYAIGNPEGLERTVSEGIVSTTNRAVFGLPQIQTTTPVNPGNSGGPLFNMKGQVIGVVFLKNSLISEGLNYAIPVTRVKRFLRDREAFAYDKDNPNTGYRYQPPPARKEKPTPSKG